jgi:hypothetical protein
MHRLIRHARHEFWWHAERLAGRIWDRACRDGISCWLDWLPAFCLRHRYAAQRRLHPHAYTAR